MKLKLVQNGLLVGATAMLLAGCFDGNGKNDPSAATGLPGEGAAAAMPWIATKNTTRINTGDPYEAAVLVSRSLWMANRDDNRPGGIVLANPEQWQHAAASADLIHHPNNGPVLFVNNDSIPEVTLNEIKRLKPAGVPSNNGVQVVLVGDLAPQIEQQLTKLGLKTDKVTGANPADVAKNIDAYYAEAANELPSSVIVGSMDDPAFTLPAVNWIAHMPEPLLYVKKDEVPKETAEALAKRNGAANVYILGPESVVSNKVEDQLKPYGRVQRIAGKDAYENSIAFARYSDPQTGFGWGIAVPGRNLSFVPADSNAIAVAAAPFSHLGKHAPLIWTGKDKMPDSVMAYVMSIQPKYEKTPTEGPYNHAWISGDEKLLSGAAQGEIDSMLEIVSASGGGHGSMGGAGGAQQGGQSSGGGGHAGH